MGSPTEIFKRDSTWRRGVIRNLTTEIFIHGRIKTSESRAKELRRHVEKMITKGKKGTLSSRRDIAAFLRNVDVDGMPISKYVVEKVAPKYKDRQGGYTRIIKAPNQTGDNTKMAFIELI